MPNGVASEAQADARILQEWLIGCWSWTGPRQATVHRHDDHRIHLDRAVEEIMCGGIGIIRRASATGLVSATVTSDTPLMLHFSDGWRLEKNKDAGSWKLE